MVTTTDDPWLAWDKLQHFGLSALGTLGAYWLFASSGGGGGGGGDGAGGGGTPPPRRRAATTPALALAASLTALAGLLKELGDGPLALWPGRASTRDGLADALGVAVAVALVRADPPLPSWAAPGLAVVERRDAGGGGGEEDAPLVVLVGPPAAGSSGAV